MKTSDNLDAAFAGESQANRRYMAFAEKAEKDGFPKIARLFRAVAEAETFHALRHFKTAGKVGTTAENVAAAAAGEKYEFTTMYPEFIAAAEAEGNKGAIQSFSLANAAEKVHGALYEKAVQSLTENKDFPAEKFYVCPVCGYVSEDGAPDKCPICGTKGSVFKEF